MLAGVAAGIFGSCEDAVERCVRQKEIIVPNPDNTLFYRKRYERYRAVAAALQPVYHL